MTEKELIVRQTSTITEARSVYIPPLMSEVDIGKVTREGTAETAAWLAEINQRWSGGEKISVQKPGEEISRIIGFSFPVRLVLGKSSFPLQLKVYDDRMELAADREHTLGEKEPLPDKPVFPQLARILSVFSKFQDNGKRRCEQKCQWQVSASDVTEQVVLERRKKWQPINGVGPFQAEEFLMAFTALAKKVHSRVRLESAGAESAALVSPPPVSESLTKPKEVNPQELLEKEGFEFFDVRGQTIRQINSGGFTWLRPQRGSKETEESFRRFEETPVREILGLIPELFLKESGQMTFAEKSAEFGKIKSSFEEKYPGWTARLPTVTEALVLAKNYFEKHQKLPLTLWIDGHVWVDDGTVDLGQKQAVMANIIVLRRGERIGLTDDHFLLEKLTDQQISQLDLSHPLRAKGVFLWPVIVRKPMVESKAVKLTPRRKQIPAAEKTPELPAVAPIEAAVDLEEIFTSVCPNYHFGSKKNFKILTESLSFSALKRLQENLNALELTAEILQLSAKEREIIFSRNLRIESLIDLIQRNPRQKAFFGPEQKYLSSIGLNVDLKKRQKSVEVKVEFPGEQSQDLAVQAERILTRKGLEKFREKRGAASSKLSFKGSLTRKANS